MRFVERVIRVDSECMTHDVTKSWRLQTQGSLTTTFSHLNSEPYQFSGSDYCKSLTYVGKCPTRTQLTNTSPQLIYAPQGCKWNMIETLDLKNCTALCTYNTLRAAGSVQRSQPATILGIYSSAI